MMIFYWPDCEKITNICVLCKLITLRFSTFLAYGA